MKCRLCDCWATPAPGEIFCGDCGHQSIQHSPVAPSAPATPRETQPTPSAASAGSMWGTVGAVLSVPFMLVGGMVLLLVSAVIVILPIVLMLKAAGADYEQFGGFAKTVLGLLVLGLTVVLAGLLLSWFSIVTDKARQWLDRRP